MIGEVKERPVYGIFIGCIPLIQDEITEEVQRVKSFLSKLEGIFGKLCPKKLYRFFIGNLKYF